MTRNCASRWTWPRLLAALQLALGLAACSTTPLGPNYRQLPDEAMARQPQAQAAFIGALPRDGSDSTPYTAAPLPPQWWQLYQDPLLDRLVQQALAGNTDLRQGTARLEQAAAIEQEVAGAGQPAVGVSAGPDWGRPPGLGTDLRYSFGASLSYQVDLFGRLHRAIEAAGADRQAAQAGLDLVRVNVAAATAKAYAEVCSSGLQLQSAQRSVQLQEAAVQATRQLQDAGRVASIDGARARSQLQQLRAALPPLQAKRRSALYRLAVLAGAPPRDLPQQVADCDTPPRVAGVIPVGDGAALLRRRPDIRQVERGLAAATARIGVAMGDLYPQITFGAAAASAGPLDSFGRHATFSWSLGPLVSWTVPNTGIAQARIAQAEAHMRATLAKFDGLVLSALTEVETALDAYARGLDQHAALRDAKDEAAAAAQQARTLYRNGKSGYLETLDAERVLAATESALAAAEALLADEQVALFLALGGGW